MSVVQTVLFNPCSEGKLMVWDKMGGGKTLTMACTAMFMMGVMFVIVLLLTLMVDKLQKLRGADP